MPTYKLTYFNAKGRAEVPRLLFAKAGVKYEDVRIQREQWATMKPTTPYGSLPVLEVDGVQIAQSYAVAEFLAKTFGLYGCNLFEEAQINGICHAVDDVATAMVKIMFEKDADKKAALKKTAEETTVPELLACLDKIVQKNPNGVFVGKEITLADIFFARGMENPQAVGVEVDCSKYPKLKAVISKVHSDPKIAAWIKSRPETSF